MVLIISEKDDTTTHLVIDWLASDNQEYVLLYPDSRIEDIYIGLTKKGTDMSFLLDGRYIQLSAIKSFWYRRGMLSFNDVSHILNEKFFHVLSRHLDMEWGSIELFLNAIFESKNHLGSFSKEKFNNKLSNLLIASQCGLAIPKTYVVSSKERLNDLSKNKKYITKSVNKDIVYNDNHRIEFANFGPMKINRRSLNNMDTHFHPSLIQEYIEKNFEIRVFVLGEELYSMAIFSQADSKTAMDYRNINFDKPTRMVPFALPLSIRNKILLFMSKINLNSGSIDMIVTKKNEYVFLEINPVGQFGFLSFNCNYNLEKKVAAFLSENSLRYEK